jgi:hypothetical protein
VSDVVVKTPERMRDNIKAGERNGLEVRWKEL